MALSKTDQVRFDGLQQTLSMLLSNGLGLPQIKNMMAPQLSDFQKATNHKIKFLQDGEVASFGLLNLSKDFVRVRGTDDTKVLRSKINGVSVDVKVVKVNEFSFSNGDIVESLRALADEIETMSVEVNTLDITADVRKGASAEEAFEVDAEENVKTDEGDDADETDGFDSDELVTETDDLNS